MFLIAWEAILIFLASAALGQTTAAPPTFEAADIHLSTESVNALRSAPAFETAVTS